MKKESCEIYTNGDYEDVPIWPSVLEDEGYECSIIDSHQHVTPYDTSKEWQQEEYPEIKEFYYIDTIEEIIEYFVFFQRVPPGALFYI